MCDWGNCIFPFDDLFDNGLLRNDFEQAQAVMRRLLATFKAGHKRCLNEDLEDSAMRNMVAFQTTIWNAIRSDSSQGIQMRYSSTMKQYGVNTIDQVHSTTLQRTPSIYEVLDKRSHSVCVAPLFALVELAYGIRHPSQVLENTIVHEIQTLGIDITLSHIDLLWYHKEETERIPHNLVAACRSMGMTTQEAADFIAGEVKRRLLHFEEATPRAVIIEIALLKNVGALALPP
ncbi:hypothetical protein Q7P37_009832 [Cladosporium fusiforme]